MPSLFSRARTTSTPAKKTTGADLDEFGRISSRGSAARQAVAVAASTKKAAKRDAGGRSTPKPRSSGADDTEVEFGPPDGSFLPLLLDKPRYASVDDPTQEAPLPHDYGYLSYSRHVVLGLSEVSRLVDVVGEELGTRGLTTPFIFSTVALDVSSSAVRRLIQTFLKTCSRPSADAERQWREEARLAGPQELGMTLRWGLARVVRWVGGQEVRGLVSYDAYLQWRDTEAGTSFCWVILSFLFLRWVVRFGFAAISRTVDSLTRHTPREGPKGMPYERERPACCRDLGKPQRYDLSRVCLMKESTVVPSRYAAAVAQNAIEMPL